MQQNLNEMAVFAVVAELGSFTKAASKLAMPKSSVSRHISQLEERIGERLLNRTTRQIRLTEIGKLYFSHCRRIVEEAESAELVLASLQMEPAGRLRISAPLAFGAPLLQGVFNDFLDRYPKIKMELILDNRNVDLIEEEIDIAIRVGPLQDSSLVGRRLGGTVLCLAATPEYLAKHGEPRSLESLEHYDVIHHPNVPLELANGKVMQVSGRFTVNDMGVVASTALNHFGIALVPLPVISQEIKQGLLVPILLDHPFASRDFYLVYPSRRQLALKSMAFIDYLLEQIQQMDYWNVSVLDYLSVFKKHNN